MRDRYPPDKTLYMPMSIGNSDGTMSFDVGPICFLSKKKAIAYAKKENKEYGLQMVIYEMKPIKHIKKRKVELKEDIPDPEKLEPDMKSMLPAIVFL